MLAPDQKMAPTRSGRHLATRLEAVGCAGGTGSQDGCRYDAAYPTFIVCGATAQRAITPSA